MFNNEFIEDYQDEEQDLDSNLVRQEGIVSYTTDWTVETIFNQINKNNFNLTPEFQRRDAWDKVKKSRLIESLILGFPIPNLVLAVGKGASESKFIVIDGKQRLLAIQQFLNNEYPLSKLANYPELNGKYYNDLSNEYKNKLDNYSIRSSVITNWKNSAILYSIFYRLNSGSLPLSAQELRKALIGSEFINYVEDFLNKESSNLNSDFNILFKNEMDKRMKDTELVLRFFAFQRNLVNYDGKLKEFLDETTKYFQEQFTTNNMNEITKLFEQLKLSINITKTIFNDDSFRKYNGDSYEKNINRAIFDIMAYFFANDSISELLVTYQCQIKNKFEEICTNNQDFQNSINARVSSKWAIFTRIDIWGNEIARIIGKSYDSNNKRII